MPFLMIIGAIALLALIFGPSLWAKATLRRYRTDRPDFPGTGGELARHLLDEADLPQVKVETVPAGDHYDPIEMAVRLEKEHHDGRSLTAIAVAAHEVGHALQHKERYGPLMARGQLISSTAIVEKIGSAILIGAPILGLVSRSPSLTLLMLVAGILTLGIQVVVHLVTLPVEFDASYKRALPVLAEGGYLEPEDLPAARKILRACALTYVASALMSLLDFSRWIRVLR